MIDKKHLFDKNFLDSLNELSIDSKELDGIYTYLAIFSDSLNEEEKAFWSIILEKFDPEYDEEDIDFES